MIIVKFSGGLGNQLYQYAFMRKLQKLYPGIKLKMDISDYVQNKVHNGFELDRLFHIVKEGMEIASFSELLFTRCEIPYESMEHCPQFIIKPAAWFNARSRKLFGRLGIRNDIVEEIHLKDNIYKKIEPSVLMHEICQIDTTKNWYFDGYWQDEIFAEDIMPLIVQELKFPEFQEKENMELSEKIQSVQSVSIHVRCGDYVNTIYDILNEKYYKAAIEYIEKRVSAPVWFIFSDDSRQAAEYFSFLKNKIIVQNNTGSKSWCDLKLMSLCKHNILANSSFSNWGGYFNKNPGKIVIYPSQYTKEKANSNKSGKGWVKIEA